MKKSTICIIAAAVVILAAVGGAVGYHYWYQNNHVFVEDAVYEKELTQVDLRGTGVSLEHYESLRQQLPDCEIRYDLPFQGGFYPDDTTELTLTSLTEEEAVLLDYLPELKRIHAEGCRDYAVLTALRQRRPDCEITYTVELYGKEYPDDTKELSFGDEKLDIQELTDMLPWLPEMESVSFDQPGVSAQDLKTLMEAFPEISITWEKDAFGTTYTSDITQIDLTGMLMESPEDVVDELAYFPALEKVIMAECGTTKKDWFDNETMAAFREKMRPEYTVVWAMKINGLTVRTDDKYFMPAKYGKVATNYQVQDLIYCEEMLCVDLGHMAITRLDFVTGMPHLKYLIVADGPLIFIEPLATCKELVYLELFRTEVSDFTPLLECTSLEDINVVRTNGDPMVFVDMPWLKHVWISPWRMTAEKREKLQAALPDAKIQYNPFDPSSCGWRDIPNYFAMRDLLGMPYNTW